MKLKYPFCFLNLVLVLSLCSCSESCSRQGSAPSTNVGPVPQRAVARPESTVKIEDLKIGTGPIAHAGQTVTINYVGRVTDGTEFDSSSAHGGPADFQLDIDHIIRGYIIGMEGMKVGGRRRLTMPPEFAYGEAGAPPSIPPSATLIFEVELIGIK